MSLKQSVSIKNGILQKRMLKHMLLHELHEDRLSPRKYDESISNYGLFQLTLYVRKTEEHLMQFPNCLGNSATVNLYKTMCPTVECQDTF